MAASRQRLLHRRPLCDEISAPTQWIKSPFALERGRPRKLFQLNDFGELIPRDAPCGGCCEAAMPQANSPSTSYCFGVFEIDLRTGELTKRGVRLKLQEQPFRLLAMLLEKPGELVTR